MNDLACWCFHLFVGIFFCFVLFCLRVGGRRVSGCCGTVVLFLFLFLFSLKTKTKTQHTLWTKTGRRGSKANWSAIDLCKLIVATPWDENDCSVTWFLKVQDPTKTHKNNKKENKNKNVWEQTENQKPAEAGSSSSSTLFDLKFQSNRLVAVVETPLHWSRTACCCLLVCQIFWRELCCSPLRHSTQAHEEQVAQAHKTSKPLFFLVGKSKNTN